MAAAGYAFVTEWTFDAPIDAVWAEINAPEQYPSWWRGVLAVELVERGDADGVGSYRRMTWKSQLPYKLRFNARTTRVEGPSKFRATSERPYLVELCADGELCGTGVWTLTPVAAGTHVRYEWTVEATKPWMRVLGPIARRAFEWNHDVVMQWGYEGLKRRLGTTGTTGTTKSRRS